METKDCSKCGEEKPATPEYFTKHRDCKGGLNSRCKVCAKANREANKEKINAQRKSYREANKEKLAAANKKWREANKERQSKYSKERYRNNREKILARNRKYESRPEVIAARKAYEADPEVIARRKAYRADAENKKARAEYHKKYYANEENRKRIATYVKEWRQGEEVKARASAKHKHRSLTDPVYRMRKLVSRHIHHGLTKEKSTKKGKSVWSKLPYTPEELKNHIEKQFEEWMTWENHGIGEGHWNLDHIIPHSRLPYDSLDHPNFLKCWDLTNLRPLCAVQNMSENNRRDKTLEELEILKATNNKKTIDIERQDGYAYVNQ